MESIREDARFSHISSDPRFRPMPKSKRKVKIDSRFQSIFTNTNFTHRSDIDKRGRPVLNGSGKQKHVMERFYDMSVSETGGTSEDESDDRLHSNETKKKSKKNITSSLTSKSKKQERTKDVKNRKRKLKASHSIGIDAQKEADSDSATSETKYNGDSDGLSVKRVKLTSKEEALKNSSGDEEEDDDAGDEDDIDSDVAEYTQDHELEETEVDHKWNELHTEAPEVSDSTRRLAVCNMDWDFVKAQDLYVLFKSFVPEGGAVRSVVIYPSAYGKERMSEEALLGPREMREQRNEAEDVRESEDSSKDRKRKQKSSGGDQQNAKKLDKHKGSAQTEKLREYQLNRLRYYYAVVDCDSTRTADNIYSECDGREYQLSSVRIDLRFVPDDMTFDDEPKESFSEEQSVLGYQPSKFNSSALSQAKVEVTWDETEFDRLSRRMSALQQKELQSIVEENKYADIIAPPESDSEDEEDGRPEWLKTLLAEDGEEGVTEKEITEEEKIRLYRKVLMEKVAEDEEEEMKEEGDVDKEMAWQPGLKSAAEKKIKKQEKKKDQSSAIIGDYLEKKKEKKKKKREEKMKMRKQKDDEKEEDLAFSDDELPAGFDVEDMKEMLNGDDELSQVVTHAKPSLAKKKKKGKSKTKAEDLSDTDDKAKAELELMLMDSDSSRQKKPAKPEVVKDSGSTKKKNKKSKLAKLKKTEEDKEDFVLDMDDPRFSALYSSHLFHIDPTAPQFKKTKNMVKLVDEQIKRKNKQSKKGKDNNQSVGYGNSNKEFLTSQADETTGTKSKSQSLIESLKRKMKK